MTIHAENPLRGACISKVLNLLLTIATLETGGAKSLVTSQYGKVFDLITAIATAVCAIVTDQRPITE